MTEQTHKEFPNTIRSETAEELLEKFDPSNVGWFRQPFGLPPYYWVFRGQRDADWQLVPTIFRGFDSLPVQMTDKNETNRLLTTEWEKIWRFMAVADNCGNQLPDDSPEFRTEGYRNSIISEAMKGPDYGAAWPPAELIQNFALAQHHGVPTRLLDWSRSPFNAAYFSAKEAASLQRQGGSEGPRLLAVWAINVEKFSALWWDAKAKSMLDTLRIQLITARGSTNENLRAQKGLFTVDRSISEIIALDDLAVEISKDRDVLPNILKKFTLPHKEAGKLLRLLSYRDIYAGTLFPGLAGVVETIKEQKLWDMNR